MALEQAGIALVAQGAAAYISDIAGADRATNSFVGGLEGAGSRASAAGEVMTGALRQVGAVAVNAMGQAAQAAGAFVADSITAAGDFEASVNNLAAISGTALAEAGFSFDDVSAKALQLGQDTAFSASESIAAMTELVKGGVPIVDVMGQATDATLALAAASGTELASAAEIVSKQLGVWGDTGVEATQVADLLTQAANASTVGVEDLALGLANSSGTAKTAGVEFNDLVQTMALIAPGFSSASDAGTSLKTMLSRLIPTTDPATVAMRDLGLYTDEAGSAFYDAQGQFIGMEAAAGLLKDATAGLTEEQRLLALQTIFGQDAIRAAAYIAEAGAEGFTAMGDSMAAAGTAAETAAIQNQGFNFAMDSLMGSVETLQIVLGSALLPILTAFITDTLIPGIGVVMQFAQAVMGNSDALGGLSPQLQGAVASVQGLMAAAQPVAEFIAANLTPILTTLAGVAGGLLVGALVTAAAPFAPLIAAMAAAGAIAAALYGAWQTNFAGIQEATSSALAAVQGVITSVLGAIQEFWGEHGAQITAFTQEAWAQIQEIIGTLAAGSAEIISNVFGAVADFISEHGDEIQTVLEFAWNSIQNIIELALDVIQGITNTVLGVLTGDWEQAAGGIEQIVSALGDYLSDQFNNIVTLVEGIGPTLMSAAQSVGQSIVDGIAGGISSAAGAIADAAMDAASAALDAAKSLLGIQSPSTVFAEQVGAPISQGMARGIIAAIPQAVAAAEELGEEVLKSVTDLGTKAQKALDDAFAAEIGGTYGVIDSLDASIQAQKDAAAAAAELAAGGQDPAEVARLEAVITRAAAAQELLNEARATAVDISAQDPIAGAAFLAKRTEQIGKLLDLQARYDEETDASARALIGEQLRLLEQAQAAELVQLQTGQERRAAELEDLQRQFGDLPADLVGGIVQALQEGIPALSTGLTGALRAALNEARAALEINSPSQVAADLIGAPLMAGVAAGIADAASMPGRVMSTALMGLASEARVSPPALGGGGMVSYGGDTYYSFDMRGSTLTEAQAEAAFTRALGARTTRGDRLSRIGGGSS